MTSALTRMVARALLAPTLVVAAAILVKGYADVGDGFAAGIVAALGILLQFLAFGRDEVAAALPVARAPVVALCGLTLAAAVFAAPLALGGAALEHWPPAGEEPAHAGSLELISAVVFDVGVFLLVLGAAVAIIDAIAAQEPAR
ncbi:MAG TPA: MnhB domain-containing protein [Solirubrobacteraceae bacterium]|nr:MnhB domain-containing protein [Solirubrobacteraceae bacterium]